MAERIVRTVKENITKINLYYNVFDVIKNFKKLQNYSNFQRKLNFVLTFYFSLNKKENQFLLIFNFSLVNP